MCLVSITIDKLGQQEGQFMKVMASNVDEEGRAMDEVMRKEDIENLEENVESLK